jgi:hypothetical protein
MKRLLALVLSVGLAAPGCTATRPRRMQVTPAADATAATAVTTTTTTRARAWQRAAMIDFARALHPGSRIRLTQPGNRTARGTLISTTDTALVFQPRARIAEPPVEIPFSDIVAIELETSNGSTGRAIAIGAAVGAGAALGVLMLIVAVAYND